eukprot:403356282
MNSPTKNDLNVLQEFEVNESSKTDSSNYEEVYDNHSARFSPVNDQVMEYYEDQNDSRSRSHLVQNDMQTLASGDNETTQQYQCNNLYSETLQNIDIAQDQLNINSKSDICLIEVQQFNQTTTLQEQVQHQIQAQVILINFGQLTNDSVLKIFQNAITKEIERSVETSQLFQINTLSDEEKNQLKQQMFEFILEGTLVQISCENDEYLLKRYEEDTQSISSLSSQPFTQALKLKIVDVCIPQGQETFDEVPTVTQDLSQLKVHNLNTDKTEMHDLKDFIISKPYELPQQSLMLSLLEYQNMKNIIEKCLSFAESNLNPQMELIKYKLVNQEFQQESQNVNTYSDNLSRSDSMKANSNINGLRDCRQENDSSVVNQQLAYNIKRILTKKDLSTSEDSDDSYFHSNNNQLLKIVQSKEKLKLQKLDEVLNLINQKQEFANKLNNLQLGQNDKELFKVIRSNREMRTLSMSLNKFIQEIQQDGKPNPSQLFNLLESNKKNQYQNVKKTILKRTNYESSKMIFENTKMESDYFKPEPTRVILEKRQQHIKKTLEWANKNLSINMSSSQIIDDSVMEEVNHIKNIGRKLERQQHSPLQAAADDNLVINKISEGQDFSNNLHSQLSNNQINSQQAHVPLEFTQNSHSQSFFTSTNNPLLQRGLTQNQLSFINSMKNRNGQDHFNSSQISQSQNPRKSDDFSFMRKTVRVNVVDSEIQEYHLEEEEKLAKQQRSRKYL